MHAVRRAAEATFEAPADWAVGSTGIRMWPVIGAHSGVVHTGFAICELDPGGTIPAHLHSFEQSFFMLEGSAVLQAGGGGAGSAATALAPDD